MVAPESLDRVCALLLEQAMPYLRTRCNDIHTPNARDMARALLPSYPEADAVVVMTAIILHDVGWKMIPEAAQRGAFGPRMSNEALRRLHETEGVRIAAEILAGFDLDAARVGRVLAIIDGHDSREQPLTIEDAIVKDADKLWRFTPTGVAIDHRRFGYGLAEYLDYLDDQVGRWMHTPQARRMARQCLVQTRAECSAGSSSAPGGLA